MSERDREPGAERDASRAADDFFREISIPLLAHELKGPLAVIEAGIRTVLEREAGGGSERDRRRERTLKRVLRGAMRAQALVEDLLEVGRAGAGRVERNRFRPQEVLVEAVHDAVDAMSADLADRVADAPPESLVAILHGGGVEIEVSPRAQSTVVEQDAHKFSLVAANLVRNALRFRKTRVAIGLDIVDQRLRLTVEDDGPGVAAGDRERVFERWARGAEASGGSRQGHGLGLAAARILARGMGGEVALEGEQGSRFVLEVPLRRPGPD